MSCYRSSGSVQIPRPTPQHFNSFLPPLKKKKKVEEKPEPAIRKAETSNVEFVAEETTPMTHDNDDASEADVADVLNEIIETAAIFSSPKILFCEPEPADEVPDLPPKRIPDEDSSKPVPAKKSNESGCRKHSRCHCSLFSKETDGFFAVQPNKWPKQKKVGRRRRRFCEGNSRIRTFQKNVFAVQR